MKYVKKFEDHVISNLKEFDLKPERSGAQTYIYNIINDLANSDEKECEKKLLHLYDGLRKKHDKRRADYLINKIISAVENMLIARN